MGPTGSVSASPKAFNSGLVPKQERTAGTGGILNLNLGQYHKHKDGVDVNDIFKEYVKATGGK